MAHLRGGGGGGGGGATDHFDLTHKDCDVDHKRTPGWP